MNTLHKNKKTPVVHRIIKVSSTYKKLKQTYLLHPAKKLCCLTMDHSKDPWDTAMILYKLLVKRLSQISNEFKTIKILDL